MTPASSTPKKRLLLVEDEPGLVLTLTDRLKNEGYTIQVATDGEQAMTRASVETFDLIVLDIMLPGKNGLDVCRDLRQRGLATPILMLTARGQIVDKVLGLKLGADDYLTKPFDMMELLARIEALLRRVSSSDKTRRVDVYRFGSVAVDFRRAEVTRDGKAVELSALELKLLRYLIEHRGDALSRDELLNEVWGYDYVPQSRTVDVHISSLRQKLEPKPSHPEHLLTVHGIGYKFVG